MYYLDYQRTRKQNIFPSPPLKGALPLPDGLFPTVWKREWNRSQVISNTSLISVCLLTFLRLNSIWQAPTWSSLEYGGRWTTVALAFCRPVKILSRLRLGNKPGNKPNEIRIQV